MCGRLQEAKPSSVGRLHVCRWCRTTQLVPSHASARVREQRPAFLKGAAIIVAASLIALSWATGSWWMDGSGTPSPRAGVREEGSGTIVQSPDRSGLSRQRGHPGSTVVPAAAVPLNGPVMTDQLDRARIATLERQLEEVREERASLAARYEALAQWLLDNVRGRVLLEEQQLPNLKFEAVTEDYALNPDLARFVRADDRERDALNDLFRYGRDTLAELERRTVSAAQPSPDSIVFYFRPFPEEGAALKNDLYSGLRAVLGPMRAERLLAVSSDSMARAYSYFGTATRAVVLTRDPSAGTAGATTGAPPLILRESVTLERFDGVRVTQVLEERTTGLPARLTHLREFLPGSLHPYEGGP